MQSWIQLDIHQVLMPWQDIAGIASLHEVYARNIITFKENELVLLLDQWLQEWTYPCNERNWPIHKKFKLLERTFKDEERYFKTQILWQRRHKLNHIFNIIFVLKLNRFLNILVEAKWQVVFPVYSI